MIEACRRNNTDLLQEIIDGIPDEDQLSKILNDTTTVMGNHLFHEAASQGNCTDMAALLSLVHRELSPLNLFLHRPTAASRSLTNNKTMKQMKS